MAEWRGAIFRGEITRAAGGTSRFSEGGAHPRAARNIPRQRENHPSFPGFPSGAPLWRLLRALERPLLSSQITQRSTGRSNVITTSFRGEIQMAAKKKAAKKAAKKKTRR